MSEQSNQVIIEQPPFPPLTKQFGSLEGTDTFVSWQSFQAGVDDSPNEVIRIVINLENPEDESPSVAQTNAYNFLKENEMLVMQKVIEGLFVDYPQIREVYGGIDPEYIPEIDQPTNFQRLIKPINIHVNSESANEFSYIGFEFECIWDIEHGLGVMIHKTKYIGCNDAEAAWNLALAAS